MLDGFLTALAIGPATLPPSRWLPLVWGAGVQWESDQQAEHVMSLILRHANGILFYLRDEPELFEPLLYERELDGEAVAVIDEWCTGFVRAIALDQEAWRPLMESEAGDEMLYPILLFGTEAGAEELQRHPELEARQAEFAGTLGDCVMSIQSWWLPSRKARSSVRHEEPKVGRNDLCPCGSGRKFKRCCGAPEKLH
jgi:uncharacterized protein